MGRRAHVRPYYYANTPNAIARTAGDPRFTAHELDVRIDADGEIWCLHWWRPMKRDYKPIPGLRRGANVAQLRTAQVRRLRTPNGWRAFTLEENLTACAKHGLVACLELKPGHDWTNPKTWARLRAIAARTGATVQAEAVPSTWAGKRGRAAANAAAKRAGFRGKWSPPAKRSKPVKEKPVPPKPPAAKKPKRKPGFIELAIAYAKKRGWHQRVRLLQQALRTRR